MLNLVIADDNIHYAKSLINYILIQHQEIRLLNICDNGIEVLEILSKNTVDLLILDLKMPFLNGFDVLNQILKMHLEVSPYILVISGAPELLNKASKHLIVSCSINKCLGIKTVSDNIGKIIQNIELERFLPKAKELIFNELKNLKFNFKHIGSTYIMEAILIVYDSLDNNLVDNLEQYAYKIIARKHNKTIKNIKSNICKATNSMYFECDQEYINNYFNFSYNYKPTPKMIINTILTKLINSIEHEKNKGAII